MIACPNCGKDNELGRIFCLKCGAKLDLNAIAAPISAKNPNLRKARKVARVLITNTILTTLKILFMALSAATITLIFMSPRLTRFKTSLEDGDLFEDKKFQLEDAVNSNNPLTVTFSEREINAMLKRHTKSLNDEFKSEVKIGSIYASCDNDTMTFSIDRKWKYFHIFLVYATKPELKNGRMTFNPVAGSVGRFPLPKAAVEPYANLLAPLWAKFKFDKQTIDQLSSIKIATNFVTLTYEKASLLPEHPAAAPSPAPAGSAPAPSPAPAPSGFTPAPQTPAPQ
jgi:zinc ribbon protein